MLRNDKYNWGQFCGDFDDYIFQSLTEKAKVIKDE